MENPQPANVQPATSLAVAQGPEYLLNPASPLTLTTLPLEIQLRILSHCTIIKKPLNLGLPLAINGMGEAEFSIHEPYSTNLETRADGQGDIDRKASQERLKQEIGIIYTCRLYLHEGTRYLMRNNDFVYTRSDDEWSRVRGVSHLRTLREYQPKPSLLIQIRHLTLQQIGFLKRYWEVETVLFLINSMEQLPALKVVGLDFLVQTGDPVPDPLKFVVLKEARWYCQGFRQYIRDGPPMTGRSLDELTITGLTHDDMGYLAVRLASTLVRPEGFMGLQVGLETVRHRVIEVRNVMRVRDVRGIRLEWVPLAGVEFWISNRHTTPYPPIRYAWRGFETKTRAFRLSQHRMDTYSLQDSVDTCPLLREWVRLVRMAEDTQNFLAELCMGVFASL